jgi:hypothetical protein
MAQSIAQRQNGSVAGGQAHISSSTEHGWKRATILYPLWYGDYRGTAPIDFYLKDAGRYRLVLVFMGWGAENEKASILNSVEIPGE